MSRGNAALPERLDALEEAVTLADGRLALGAEPMAPQDRAVGKD